MPRSHAYVLGAKEIEKLRMQLFSWGGGDVRLPKVGVLPARKENSGIWTSPKLETYITICFQTVYAQR